MYIVLTILLIVFIVLMIINMRMELEQMELLEDYDDLITTQWELEKIILDAKAKKRTTIYYGRKNRKSTISKRE